MLGHLCPIICFKFSARLRIESSTFKNNLKLGADLSRSAGCVIQILCLDCLSYPEQCFGHGSWLEQDCELRVKIRIVLCDVMLVAAVYLWLV
jgi:hypothetical protein